MTTTELIELLKSVEFGASGRPREISISYNSGEMFFSEPDISISGTGDGVAGAELSLGLTGEVWVEEEEQKCRLDEPDKPVIPNFVAEWIEVNKKYYSLSTLLNHKALKQESAELYHWVVTKDNEEVLCRAWFEGYKVEE